MLLILLLLIVINYLYKLKKLQIALSLKMLCDRDMVLILILVLLVLLLALVQIFLIAQKLLSMNLKKVKSNLESGDFMSNKTTAILTFLVSTVIPFIQEIVDFVEMFRTGSYNREGSATLKAMSMAMQDDLVNMQKRGASDDVNGFRHAAAAATGEKTYSRFLGKNS